MRKLSADIVYSIADRPVRNGVVVVDDSGTVLHTGKLRDYDPGETEHHEGALVPGFVNTHCHLELSHMFGKVDTGRGLIPFISDVVRKREALAETIREAVAKAEDEMIAEGIVAVGDISNTMDTLGQKEQGRLKYYTFVEMFDFLLDKEAKGHFDNYFEVYQKFSTAEGIDGRAACVPHSPYSVSRTLFRRLRGTHSGENVTISIHNQEMAAENALFLTGTGELIDFYESFGIPLTDFKPIKKTSIWYALEQLDPGHRTLFVHNTFTKKDEIDAAHDWSAKVYWATCPNANLYIENRLPDYRAFMEAGARLTIGTDSLTSNWQLSILEEMKTIRKYNSYIPTEHLLEWATINGAHALGFEDELGSIERGKRPGINLLTGLDADFQIAQDTAVKRLV